MSAAIASCAARLISAGAGKSGKPCARLTASYIIAFRVISRITDSVKCATLPLRKDFVGVATSAIVGKLTGVAESWPSWGLDEEFSLLCLGYRLFGFTEAERTFIKTYRSPGIGF